MYIIIKSICKIIGFKTLEYATKKTKERTEEKLNRVYKKKEKEIISKYEKKIKIIQESHKREKIENEHSHCRELQKMDKSNQYYKKTNEKYKEKRNDFIFKINNSKDETHKTMDLMISQFKKMMGKLEELALDLERDYKKNDKKIEEKFYKADTIVQNVYQIKERRILNNGQRNF